MNTKKTSQTKSLQLSKHSTPMQLKSYFQQIFELKQSGKLYPVDLDYVWHLGYSRKEDAVRNLKQKCIENAEYQIFSEIPKNSKKGRPSEVYKLSISCFEFLIARQNRPVFDVYRKIFHRVYEILNAQSILGVEPTIINGEVLYLYKAIKQALGYLSFSAKRDKALYGEHFRISYGRNFITADLCKKLIIEKRGGYQLQLNLFQNQIK